jgi:hypothetical protein
VGIAVIGVALYTALTIAANIGVEFHSPQWTAMYLPHTATNETTTCQASQRFRIAQHGFDQARGLISSANYAQANSVLLSAIDELGHSYEKQWVLDDTGLGLGVAEFATRKGDIKMATGMRCRILRDRLELCGEILRWHRVEHPGAKLPECPK